MPGAAGRGVWRLLMRRRRLALITGTLAGLLCVLVAAEFAVRAFARYDTFHGWGTPTLAEKMDQLEHLHARFGRVDVLVLSSSIAKGLDPEEWYRASGGRVAGYNAAVPFHQPEEARFLWERVYHPRFAPKCIIHCITLADVLPGMIRHNRRTGYRKGPLYANRAVAEARASDWLRPAVALLHGSALFELRAHLRADLTQRAEAPVRSLYLIGDFGASVRSCYRVGEHPLSDHYQRWFRTLSGDEDIVASEIDEIRNFAAACRAAGTAYYLVDYGLAPRAEGLLRYSERLGNAYRDALASLREDGVNVLHAASDLPRTNDDFEDMLHDNRWGVVPMNLFLYDHIIRQQFPDAPPASREETRAIGFARDYPGHGDVREFPAPDNRMAGYAEPQQLLVESETPFVLAENLSRGTQWLEVYYGDLREQRTEPDSGVSFEIRVNSPGAAAPVIATFTRWAVTLQGESYAAVALPIADDGSTVSLTVRPAHDHPVILDAAFLTQRAESGAP